MRSFSLNSRTVNSLNVDKRRCLELILVAAQIELRLLLESKVDLLTHIVINLSYQGLFVFVFTDLLFHVAKTVCDDLTIEVKLQLLPLNAFVLLLNFDRKEVIHVVVLLDLL